MIRARTRGKLDEAQVVTKALLKAAGFLQLSQADIASVLQTSPSTISRVFSDEERFVKLDSPEGKLALLFLRVFRSLDALVGGDSPKARDWLLAHNRHLDGIPMELLKTIQGLVHVADYLDAMRGKV